jgi:ferritin-like metal-binding protein YciE
LAAGSAIRKAIRRPRAEAGATADSSFNQQETHMSLFGKNIARLDELFADELKNVYYMENEIVENLPDMIEAATSPDLKQALSAHLSETKGQVKRLEQVFELHGTRAESGSCAAIDGLIKTAGDAPSEIEDKKVLDAAIVAAAQQIEHHEIAVYGSIIAWAKELGRDDCASILAETIAEEKSADQKLSALAEGGINRRAA